MAITSGLIPAHDSIPLSGPVRDSHFTMAVVRGNGPATPREP